MTTYAMGQGTTVLDRIINMLWDQGINLGNLGTDILDLYNLVQAQGDVPLIVDKYLSRGEIDSSRVNEAIHKEMVNYLISLGLTFDGAFDVNGDLTDAYDEYLALSYKQALDVSYGRVDPINQIYQPGKSVAWNFEVDYYQDVEDIEVEPENVRAAGALMFVKQNDRAGVFATADRATERWSLGSLNIQNPDTVAKLYRYHKRRNDRLSDQERQLAYHQVFAEGNVQSLPGMRVNAQYRKVMDSVLNEAVEFISKTESNELGGYGNVSKEPLFQAMRTLRYNLSSHTQGKVHMDIFELYAQLQDCIDILRSPEVISQMAGGSYQSIWGLVERTMEEMGQETNVAASKTAAVEADKIFKFLADFDYTRRHAYDITPFLRSIEAFILAQSQLGEVRSMPSGSHHADAGEYDEFEEVMEDDDFDNWD
ncbi:MAG: hypothetical protein AAFQ98_23090 [Bacteroidota bacterium]